MSHDFSDWTVLVGRVRGRWDKSNLKIQPFSETKNRFAGGAELLAVKGTQKRLLTLKTSRKMAGHWIADCGLNSTEEAESLVGAELFITLAMRPKLPAGEFYLDELIGVRVVTENGDDWGEIEEVLEGKTQNTYVTPVAMIPGVPEFVVQIDWKKRVLVVRDMPGLKVKA